MRQRARQIAGMADLLNFVSNAARELGVLQLSPGISLEPFEVGAPAVPTTRESFLLESAARMLRARGYPHDAELLERLPFRLRSAVRHSGEEFLVLRAEVGIDEYEALRKLPLRGAGRGIVIGQVLFELGCQVNQVGVALSRGPTPPPRRPEDEARRLTRLEAETLVYQYLGVEGGYLADFSRASLRTFYVALGLDLDPVAYEGTTRERFLQILLQRPPAEQAVIVEGVLARYPIGSSELRTVERGDQLRAWVARLRGTQPVASPAPSVTSAVVERALADAERAIAAGAAASAVDRAHTALHGYLLAVCAAPGLSPLGRSDQAAGRAEGNKEPRIDELLAHLRQHHPALVAAGPRASDVTKLLRTMAQAAEALNPLRNHASVAHPVAAVLDPPEAMLAVNAARTLLHYVDAKLSAPQT